MGGQERRRVVEAQEEAEEADGFERRSEEGSIVLSYRFARRISTEKRAFGQCLISWRDADLSVLMRLVSHRVAYYGLSLGAVWGPVMTTVEPRFKASVLVAGGLPFERLPSEIEPLNFAPRVQIPTLMLNGRDDFMFPVNSSQLPLFRLLGVPEPQNRHVLFDSGHVPPMNSVMKESLDWLDRYLGPILKPEGAT